MKLEVYINMINHFHALVEIKRTGNPSVFAGKLMISRYRLLCFIDELKDMHVPIDYCHDRRSYYYTRPYKIQVTLKLSDSPPAKAFSPMDYDILS